MASYTDLFVHLVWATAGRRPIVSPEAEAIIYPSIATRCRGLGCVPLAIGGVADHVHLLCALSPMVAVATLAKEVKGASSHAVGHRLHSGPVFRWQGGYGAFSLRGEDTSTVRAYILRQKQHHAAKTVTPAWETIPPSNDLPTFTSEAP